MIRTNNSSSNIRIKISIVLIDQNRPTGRPKRGFYYVGFRKNVPFKNFKISDIIKKEVLLGFQALKII